MDSVARIAFLGTPDVAATTLIALAEEGHDIAVAITQPDKRRGRGGTLLASPVKVAAEARGIPVSHRTADAAGCAAELGVVVAYGRIIKPEVLKALPMVNVHFSLLPRWRGAAPVERAILAGDTETGVCLMEVVDELDAGGVYAVRRTTIGEDESAADLRRRLADAGTELLISALSALPESLGTPHPQVGEPVYAQKIHPDELRLDWTEPAERLARVVRLGRAWTVFRGRRLVVWRARVVHADESEAAPGRVDGTSVATGRGVLELVEVQPEGKRRMDAAEWIRGANPASGEVLG